ncbi:MAG: signal peptidase II [Proteobacteria bacterium]|nr:signal peptidase II [Pseudomonadota bacterium]MBU1140788.1 signal peptidase II [Pseudomonadota bacterium]MBU1234726.1 signal peptidase II [Pseudomonadota bacterium]MBU1418136.1 signal peptidase II [Pseudomonadota bacterium]MBU1453268.1 signal peptidase II [Pseudomonadota bacterium]
MLSLFLLVLVVALDQLTKIWVVNGFQLYEIREIIPGLFNLTYLTNKGAAFGFLAGVTADWRHYFFLGLVAVALVLLSVFYVRLRKEHPFYGPALALIAGGAIGNAIDRIRLGAVVDFLDFYVAGHHWPAFNVADSAITVGVAIFLVANILEERQKKRAAAGS